MIMTVINSNSGVVDIDICAGAALDAAILLMFLQHQLQRRMLIQHRHNLHLILYQRQRQRQLHQRQRHQYQYL